MKTFEYKITDPGGIHARIACVIAKKAAGMQSRISLIYNGSRADGSQVVDLMSLAVPCGGIVGVEIEGEDEAAETDQMIAYFTEKI